MTGKTLAWNVFLRSLFSCLWLNPLTTRLYDWVRPAGHLGLQGERAAQRYLRKQGYIILAHQYSNKYGELDLIATKQQTVVIVEVKTRRSDQAGLPAEAVDARKQARISRAALAYLSRHDLLEHPARFDVIGVLWPPGKKRPVITHYINAFETAGLFQMYA